jgi:hypothetical protein
MSRVQLLAIIELNKRTSTGPEDQELLDTGCDKAPFLARGFPVGSRLVCVCNSFLSNETNPTKAQRLGGF